MTRLSPKPNAGPPTPVRHAPARPYIVLGSAVVAAIFLILVVLNMGGSDGENDNAQQQAHNEQTPVDIEVFGPGELTEEDLATAEGEIDPEMRLNIPKGGWIQVPDEHGGVAQQYKFASSDPNPPGYAAGWVQMEDPVAQIFVAEDRMLLLEGDVAFMHMPNRALESGTMTGSVTIRLYETQRNQVVDLAVDEPSLVVRTREASFNNILGELHCPQDVLVETAEAEFPGHNLHMLINDRDQVIQSLTVERGEYIRIAGSVRDGEAGSQHAPTDAPPSATPSPPLASSPQSMPEPSAQPKEPFYLVTLHDNVRIIAGTGDDARTVKGDSLEVTFSFRSEGMAGAMAFIPPSPRDDKLESAPAAVAMSSAQHIFAATSATRQDRELLLAPPADDDDIYIYWDGQITMEPITDPAEQLASTSDARLELFGSPITLTTDDGMTEATCASLAYHTDEGKPTMLASAEYPGTIVRREPAPQHDLGDADGELVEELRITWGRQLKLDFFESSDGVDSTKLRHAEFADDVNVSSPDLDMRADNMKVDFFAETERDAIKSIVATGNIVAGRPPTSPDGESKLIARDLLVEFALNDENEAYARHARATGDVEASDKSETMWADVIDVVLREVPETAASQAEPEDDEADVAGVAGLAWGDGRTGQAELEKLTATDDVQLLLEGGTRVWSDTLDVDGINKSITLTGEDEDIMIASGNHVVDKGTHIQLRELDEFRREVLMNSPGVFIQYNRQVLPKIERRRIERPVIVDDPQVSVRWTERMNFQENTDLETSAIEFHGQVDGRSEPTPLERSTVTADTLRLEFIEQPAEDANEVDANGGEDPLAGDRTIRRLYAAGDAKIESRSWENEDRSDVPRVFYIAGGAIDYDDALLNADVTGEGSLLIRDERPEGRASEQPVVVAHGDRARGNPLEQENFGSRGTTLFRFTDGMTLRQQMENRFLATFSGNVEWLHKALDGRTATLTGQHLEAVISRRSEPEDDVDLDFGGAADLERIAGKGALFINTATRDVECEAFSYDPTTGVAELADASVLTQGARQPFHAQRIIWYMNDDRMTIVGGTVNR